LFFCQREAVETLIHLAEVRLPGKAARLRYKPELSEEDLHRMLRGERPSFLPPERDTFPVLSDDGLRRLGCKMATGAGKTVVMAMLIAWAFCNRGRNPASRDYPNGVLVCCPNLTVKERLQVLRPESLENYYAAFDLAPLKYRPLLQAGRVLVTNWHAYAPESPHVENGKSYLVVDKGPETPETFARRVLGDLADRLPILVLNDEGHHCWRPRPAEEALTGEERTELEAEREEATVWIQGLDWINRASSSSGGVALCVDLSATPFYLKGSGHPEGRPFPWLVSDFGLVDAIESGIVKIPRLPVSDTTGRPDAQYFKLWQTINDQIGPAERLPGRAKKPKPEAVYSRAEGALQQLAGQWAERFWYSQNASAGQDRVPPVLIVVCDNTDIAELFYRKISGETEVDGDDAAPDEEAKTPPRSRKPRKRIEYGQGSVFPEFFANTPAEKRTIRIDSKLLAEAESADPAKARSQAAEELRRVVATVGKKGQPGEHVRCVVSVSMLTEGWDANNVTHILGVRAFGSQLLCEQVVGRGLRRMDYTPDPATGLLTEEYVDVYGIPFSVIPYKGRPVKAPAPEDRPKNHVRALPERVGFELRFPVVEGYAFALRQNHIRCDLDGLESLALEPNREPTATFVRATVGYLEGGTAQAAPVSYEPQDRTAFYDQTHLQTVQFVIARLVVERLLGAGGRPAFRLRSRHELFPQVYRLVEEYVRRKVDFRGCNECELGLVNYITRIVERLGDGIEPDHDRGEAPLLPILNRYQPLASTAGVNFKTVRPCRPTQRSHVNLVVLDTDTWEASAAFRLENAAFVRCYARNDELGLTIPYEYQGVDHAYSPDYLVQLIDGLNVVLEIKGFEDDQDKAKHNAARRWVSAVNHWGELGRWVFHVCRDPHLLEQELRQRLTI
jgi:type III restriction enzyme